MAATRESTNQDNLLRIVLVGKTGVGKSAVGNTILRKEVFRSGPSSSSVTADCDKAGGEFEGQKLVVVDTPGVFDTNRTNEETMKKIALCISFASPGPHVFLVVLEIGRFTDEDHETLEMLQTLFGVNVVSYIIVLFTHGDKLKRMTLQKYLDADKTKLSGFLAKCANRYHVFNNEDVDDPIQVTELLKKIKTLVARNGGSHYTNDMFMEAEKAIEEEKRRLLQESGPRRIREEEVLKKQLCGEKLRKALKDLEEKYENEARAEAEKDNSFIKSCCIIVGSTVVAGGLGAGVGALAVKGATIGSVTGPQGALIGAVGGAVVGLVGSTTIVLSKKCSIQ